MSDREPPDHAMKPTPAGVAHVLAGAAY